MNYLKFLITASFILFMATSGCSQKNNSHSSALAHFVASTPCSHGTKPIPGIPLNNDYDFIKWDLRLYEHESAKTPSHFTLHCTYGMSQQGSTGFVGGGSIVDLEGDCTIRKGMPSNTNAIVYQLTDRKSGKTISLVKLSDDLLHLLDSDLRLMIGTAAWSYTMNRAN
jgi:hypothetical protein